MAAAADAKEMLFADTAAPRTEPDPGKSGWFYRLPFLPKQKPIPELQNTPVGIEIVSTDAESRIEAG